MGFTEQVHASIFDNLQAQARYLLALGLIGRAAADFYQLLCEALFHGAQSPSIDVRAICRNAKTSLGLKERGPLHKTGHRLL